MLFGLKYNLDLDRILDSSLAAKAVPANLSETFKKLLSDIVEGHRPPREAAQKLLDAMGDHPVSGLLNVLTTLIAALPKGHHKAQQRLIAFMAEIAKENEEKARLEQRKVKEEALRLQLQVKQLQEETAFWQELFNSLTEGVSIFGPDGQFYDFNDALCGFLGYSRKELRQLDWQQLTPPEYLERDRQYVQKALAGEVVRYEKVFRHKDGHLFPALISYRLLKKRPGWDQDRLLAIQIDLSAEKTREKELARIRAAVDVSDAKVMIADPAGMIVYANDSVQKLFSDYAHEVRKRLSNFDPQKLVGSSCDAYHRDPKRTQALIMTLTGPHRTTIEFGDRTFAFVANPIFMEDERIGTAVEWRDVTEELQVQKEVENLIVHIKKGDFDMRLSPKEGLVTQRLSDAINALLEECLVLIQYSQWCLSRLAQAEIIPDEEEKLGAAKEIQKAYNETVAALQDLITSVREVALSIETSSQELSQSQQELSNRASREAATLEEISANVEEISAAVSENSKHAENTEKLAHDVVERTFTGKTSVDEVKEIIINAANGAKETSLISRAIQQIAFQTNILSLNASVEAARAGDHGRGFAVIAEEIRKLAVHASDEARRAEEIIGLLQAGMEKGEKGMLAVSEQVEGIQNSAAGMAEHIKAIVEASKEQDEGLMELAKAIAMLEEALSQNAAMSEEIHATSEALKAQTGALTVELSRFYLGAADGSAETPLLPFQHQDFSLVKAIQEAIRKHLVWRRHFVKALDGGKVNPQQMGDDSQCDLGRWLRESKLIRSHPQYEEVMRLHRAFHEEAGRIAKLIKDGQKEKAKEALRRDGRYNQLSEGLVSALNNLLRDEKPKLKKEERPSRKKGLPPPPSAEEWEEF